MASLGVTVNASAQAASVPVSAIVACAGHCVHVGRSATWNVELSTVPHAAPRRVTLEEIDGFEASAQDVARLRAQHIIGVCYISAGTWESWRPDANAYPTSVLGAPDAGWSGERWVDIRAFRPGSRLFEILLRRVAMCRAKGFGAIDFDNVDGFTNVTGFALTGAQQLVFNEGLAAMAHRAGLLAFLKNDVTQIRTLAPHFDGAVGEQCHVYGECALYEPFLRRGAPVLDIEYEHSVTMCPYDDSHHIFGVVLDRALDGKVYEACRVVRVTR